MYRVVDGLVTDAPLRVRLADVAIYLIHRISDKFDDDPILNGKLHEIARRLTKVKAGPGDKGDIDATCKRLSDEEAEAIARDIVGVAFGEIQRLRDHELVMTHNDTCDRSGVQ